MILIDNHITRRRQTSLMIIAVDPIIFAVEFHLVFHVKPVWEKT